MEVVVDGDVEVLEGSTSLDDFTEVIRWPARHDFRKSLNTPGRRVNRPGIP